MIRIMQLDCEKPEENTGTSDRFGRESTTTTARYWCRIRKLELTALATGGVP
ncbi:hypothetical protein Htur_2862 [Haloterrigena turkmenica DSM 5511]|uniref:Uncharacterized protein n=1 Tax=Haloterrigena turkmenica (strain ATCC 51198 / DSM 5511 / JCM 9101 / NCIMB 13204 / VKM B-1734 / 4k) TaxID=543526 RepID=D2RXK7_HALTV|nr:hypothetical protein Htur_2862 [Haloterrigena turkmenica DSM 5511]